jgi:hypothetical protein
MEVYEFCSFAKIDIHRETDLRFGSICEDFEEIVILRRSGIMFLITKRKGDIR